MRSPEAGFKLEKEEIEIKVRWNSLSNPSLIQGWISSLEAGESVLQSWMEFKFQKDVMIQVFTILPPETWQHIAA